MRLLVLSQSERVKSLGIVGAGNARENFLTLRLSQERHGTLAVGELAYPIDLAGVTDLA